MTMYTPLPPEKKNIKFDEIKRLLDVCKNYELDRNYFMRDAMLLSIAKLIKKAI